jgi:ethanolamine ammonia-lyase small subunit
MADCRVGRVLDQARSDIMTSASDDPTAAVLDLLIGEHPGLLHVEELVRLYARGSVEHDAAARIADDAISELLASGLAHRLDQFVFASRAALHGRHLAR